MKTFSLIGFSSSCDRLFDLELTLEAATPEEAAKILGCGHLLTPCLEGKIIHSLINECRRNPSIRGSLLLTGRPRLSTIAKAATSDVDGQTMVLISEARRLFIRQAA